MMEAKQTGERTRRLTVAVVLAAALYAAAVPLKLDSDLFMVLLRPLWLARSNFAVNDWYCSLPGYDGAYTYGVSLLAIACPSKEALLVVLYVLYAGLHFAMALVFAGVFRKGRGGFAAWLVMLVLFRALCDRPYYSYHFMPGYPTPASVAAVFMLMALACLLQGRRGWGVILLGAASVFHLNTFILSCIVLLGLVPYWLIRREVDRRLLGAGAVFVILAVPSVWIILTSMQAPPEVRQAADRIITNVRAPHHYKTSEFPLLYTHAAWAPLVLCVLTVAYSLLRQGRRALGQGHYLLGVLLVVVLLNALLTLGVNVPAVARLNLVRLLPFAYFVGLCILASDLTRHLREWRWDHLAVVALVAWLIRRGLPKEMLWTGGLAILLAAVLLAVREAPGRWLREGIVALVIGMKVFSPVANVQGIVADAAGGTLVDSRAPGVHRPVYDWLRGHTPVGAIVLADPALDDVRFFSERAVVANFKCAPYSPADVVEWYRRIGELTRKDVPDLWRSSDYAAKGLEELGGIAGRYAASYILVPSGSRGDEADRPAAYRDGEFVVFRVADLGPPPASAPGG